MTVNVFFYIFAPILNRTDLRMVKKRIDIKFLIGILFKRISSLWQDLSKGMMKKNEYKFGNWY